MKRQKRKRVAALFAVAILLMVTVHFSGITNLMEAKAETVNVVPDENLRIILNELMDKGEVTDDITREQLATIDKYVWLDSSVTNLEGLQYCTNITGFALYNCEADVSPILGATDQFLNCTIINYCVDSTVSFPDFASVMPNVTNVIIKPYNYSDISNIDSIKNFSKLTTLEISSCRALTGLPDLSGLTQLEKVSVTNSKNLSDISGLAGATSIKDLTITHNYTLSDVSVLSGLTNLESLKLEICTKLSTGLSGICVNKPYLKKLYIDDCFDSLS